MTIFKHIIFALSQILGIVLLLGQIAHAADPVPVPWNGMDIGDLKPPGKAQADKDTFTITGSGTGMAEARDQFHYVYQTVTGDFSLVARVTPQAGAGEWAKAGLMARDALAAETNFVGVFQTPGHGALYQYRTPYMAQLDTKYMIPAGIHNKEFMWLRLVKRGTQINCAVAADVNNAPLAWKYIGPRQTIGTGMVYVGLYVTSQTQGKAFTATFDHVALTLGLQTTLDNGTYTIVPASAPALMLTAGATDGAVAQIATPDNSPGQKWVLTNKGNGLYAIQPASNPALALAVAGAKSDNGAKVIVQTDQGNSAERWRIIPNDNGTYGLAPQFAPGSGLDDLGGNTKPGTPLDIWQFLPNDQHTQWIIDPVP